MHHACQLQKQQQQGLSQAVSQRLLQFTQSNALAATQLQLEYCSWDHSSRQPVCKAMAAKTAPAVDGTDSYVQAMQAANCPPDFTSLRQVCITVRNQHWLKTQGVMKLCGADAEPEVSSAKHRLVKKGINCR